MITLCSPLNCPMKDNCRRYADAERLERGPIVPMADYSQAIVNGECLWYWPLKDEEKRE